MPTTLITGAGRGIGLEFVRQFAADDWEVIATCRDRHKALSLRKLANKCENICLETLNVADELSIKRLAKKLRGKAIDVLINNAGIYTTTTSDDGIFSADNIDPGQKFGSLDARNWLEVLRTNVIAPLMVTEGFLPNLLQGKEKKIIMITSRAGSIELVKEGGIAYRSSKAALNSATRNISITLRNKDLIAVSLHPGWVQTDMGGKNGDITKDASVMGMRKIIAGLTTDDSGQFLTYNGDKLPW